MRCSVFKQANRDEGGQGRPANASLESRAIAHSDDRHPFARLGKWHRIGKLSKAADPKLCMPLPPCLLVCASCIDADVVRDSLAVVAGS